MRKSYRILLRLLICTILPLLSFLHAQEAELHGTVTDEVGETLIGATVRVVGSVIGTSTDIDGEFSLEVAPGSIRLVVSYIGYENFDTLLQVGIADREIELDIVMRTDFLDAGEVIVFGRRATGQSQALRVQQSSLLPQTIIHAELFNKYPDITLAETVQRMPGVTITRNRGEGERVQVRGLPEQYTALLLNGQRLPDVQQESDRTGSLDIIQSNLVEEVRVIKARTADLDADAIGGTVDFRLRQPEEQLEVMAQAGVGSNFGFDQEATKTRGVQQGAIVLNSELSEEKVYALAAGSYFRHGRGHRLQRFDYGNNGVTSNQLQRSRPLDNDRVSEKIGLIGAVELRPSIYNRMRLSYNYSATNEDLLVRETNFRRQPDFYEETRQSSKWREERSVDAVMLEVENNFKKIRLDYALSFSNTRTSIPQRSRDLRSLSVVENSPPPFSTVDPLRIAETNPFFSQFQGEEFSDFQRVAERIRLDEEVAIGSVNLTRYISQSKTSFLRIGGRYRIKEREFLSNWNQLAASFSGDVPGQTVLGGEFPDLDAFPIELDSFAAGSLRHTYTAEQRIFAGYAMYVANWTAQLTSSFGVRYELTEFEYDAPPRFPGEDRPVAGALNYDDLFPSINLTYRVNRERQFRLSYHSAIARTPYATLVPSGGLERRLTPDLDAFTFGNPEVRPTYSQNFDLTYERYGRRDGLLSIGLYAKFLRDPTVRVASFDAPNFFAVPSLRYSLENTPNARLLGLEVAIYQNLGFLHQNLRFVSVNGTLNVNDYNVEENAGFDEQAGLAQAPRRSANLSIVYSNPKSRLNLVVAGNYRSSSLDYIQDGQPIWIRSIIGLDVAADYELVKNFSVYARLNNLTDHGYDRFIGKPDEPGALIKESTSYGVWGVIGLRYQ